MDLDNTDRGVLAISGPLPPVSVTSLSPFPRRLVTISGPEHDPLTSLVQHFLFPECQNPGVYHFSSEF